MVAQVLDGRATASAIKGELKVRVAALRERGVVPGLGTLLVGSDPGSMWYVNGKHKDCAEVGIESIRVDLPETATQEEIEEAVRALNEDPACTGYIVQLPLPKGIDENRVLGLIDPAKDADGLHPTNLGWLVLGEDAPLPCTPHPNPGDRLCLSPPARRLKPPRPSAPTPRRFAAASCSSPPARSRSIPRPGAWSRGGSWSRPSA